MRRKEVRWQLVRRAIHQHLPECCQRKHKLLALQEYWASTSYSWVSLWSKVRYCAFQARRLSLTSHKWTHPAQSYPWIPAVWILAFQRSSLMGIPIYQVHQIHSVPSKVWLSPTIMLHTSRQLEIAPVQEKPWSYRQVSSSAVLLSADIPGHMWSWYSCGTSRSPRHTLQPHAGNLHMTLSLVSVRTAEGWVRSISPWQWLDPPWGIA